MDAGTLIGMLFAVWALVVAACIVIFPFYLLWKLLTINWSSKSKDRTKE
jgi:ABC-type molybdate transport system permease subunit